MQPQTANEIREAFLERSAPGSTHRFADELVLEQFHLAGLGQHPILLKFLAATVIDDVAEWKKAKIAAYSLLGKTRAKGPVLNAIGAKLFFEELLASVETLTGIVEEHGARTLADLMYLQNAILNGGFIDHYPGESEALDIASALPSGDIWQEYVKVEYIAGEFGDEGREAPAKARSES